MRLLVCGNQLFEIGTRTLNLIKAEKIKEQETVSIYYISSDLISYGVAAEVAKEVKTIKQFMDIETLIKTLDPNTYDGFIGDVFFSIRVSHRKLVNIKSMPVNSSGKSLSPLFYKITSKVYLNWYTVMFYLEKYFYLYLLFLIAIILLRYFGLSGDIIKKVIS